MSTARLEDLAHAAGRTPFLLLHLAACATLAGGLNAKELEATCQREKEHIESDWKLPELLDCLENRALPAEDGASGATPIVPDIVGEAFVLEVFRQPGHEPEETVARVAMAKLRPVIRTLVRLIQDFAPDPANPKKEDEHDQKRSLELLIHLLRQRAGIEAAGLRDEDFWEISAALPLDTTAMREPARDFYRAIAGSRELAQGDLVAIEALEGYGMYSGSMGQRGAALDAMAKVVPLRRKLAVANPGAFLPGLAGSLIGLSNGQSEMGQRAEALASIAEAVTLYRKLAGANPDAFLPDLAKSLNNQSVMQREMGKRAEALASNAEAVILYRKLAGANPDAFLPALAMSLNNQSNSQSDMGQRVEGLASVAEAVTLYRKLAGANPDAFLPDLATSLNNQSNSQSDMGQRADALASIAEAVTIHRRLARIDPDAFLPALAMSLNNQSGEQSAMGERANAVASIDEAVRLCCKLADANPAAFLPELATSYCSWGQILIEHGEAAEAAEKFAEGSRLIAPLATRLPQAYLILARNLAEGYIQACKAAGIPPDPKWTWPIDKSLG